MELDVLAEGAVLSLLEVPCEVLSEADVDPEEAPDEAGICCVGGDVMGVKLIGFEKLEAKLTKNMDLSKVKATVKKNGAQLQKTAQKNAPIDTGNLRQKITLEITDGGKTAEVESTAEYGAYVELGTRFMKAQPYLKPAFEEQKEKFKADMKGLVR